MATKFDVIISGGGMVGLALANLLDESLKIALMDPQPMPSLEQVSAAAYGSRVSAISGRSKNILQQAKVWSEFPAKRIAPYQSMVVWEENGSSELAFHAQQIAAPNLGHIIENDLIRAALFAATRTKPNISLFTESIDELQNDDSKLVCRTGEGNRLEAKLLVGADGALSKVREMAHFETQTLPYHQQALVANIETELPHGSTAWQRFLATGPMAYLPLPSAHQCSIVWSMDDALCEQQQHWSKAYLEQRIAAALDHRLGSVNLISDCVRFPLIARHSRHYVQPRIALVGDAAHTIHPLAGQGVNLGFADAQQLAAQINASHNKQADIGLLRHLRPYERKRKADNHLTQKAMTGLNWAYHQQNPALVLARNLTVGLLNNTKAIKSRLIRQAMGI